MSKNEGGGGERIINDTRIKYIRVLDKIYEVEKISFFTFEVEATETDLTLADIPEEEVFNLSNFKEFHVKLRNWHGNVIDLVEIIKNRELVS